jgi:hypothetical protein
MDRIENLLRRIRDPRSCAELLLGAGPVEARGVAGQLAAVLSALPAAHRELDQGAGLPGAGQGAVRELMRRLGGLELLLMRLAAGPRGDFNGSRHPSAGDHRAARARWVHGLGRLDLP